MTETEKLYKECLDLLRKIRHQSYSAKRLRAAREALLMYAAYKQRPPPKT